MKVVRGEVGRRREYRRRRTDPSLAVCVGSGCRLLLLLWDSLRRSGEAGGRRERRRRIVVAARTIGDHDSSAQVLEPHDALAQTLGRREREIVGDEMNARARLSSSATTATAHKLIVDDPIRLVAGELPYAEVMRTLERRRRDLDAARVVGVRRLDLIEHAR